ncbi:MAG TPA: hypothetical protein VJV79_18735 [Polyangiaceae bacterium]|nr:hypothetical protein [Polyangiaceae bacterium]
MSSGDCGRAGWASVCGLVVAVLAWGEPAAAQVTQTDAVHTPLPQPVDKAEANLVNDSWAWNANTMVDRAPDGTPFSSAIRYGEYYAPPSFPQFVTGDAITLQGLFKWRKESLDAVQDAKTDPGYFSAKCGFTAELVLLGGNCQAQLGWYNVTDPTSKIPPAVSEIFPVFTGKPQDQLNCVQDNGTTRKIDGYCPLAWDNRHPRDLSTKRWTPKSFPSGDLSKDPRYKGGYVGFAMIGDPVKCPQNKFSMYEHNQRNASGVPWVTTLIYQSKLDSNGFYLAFEDLPMSTADWTKTSDGKPGANGDFNDNVYYVSGLTCAGGNQACYTAQFGACAIGRTDCAIDGQSSAPACRSVLQASTEVCDNVDNDCDGVVDDGAGLCPNSNAPICFLGACVATCKGGAFSCPIGTTCDSSGRCTEPTCAGLSCQPGSVCRNGACSDQPCLGVVCPYGSQCELGQCIDPCAGVACASDRVCDRGLCIAKCDCNGCATGLSCGSDGRCVDAACVGKACLSGTTCRLGSCIDPCAGVACPGKDVCSNGFCRAPSASGGNGGGTSAGGALSFGGNPAAGAGSGGTAGAGTGGTAEAGAAGAAEGGVANAGAPDDVAGSSNTAGAALAAGGSSNQAGTTAAGGIGSNASEPAKSSGCSFALPGQAQSQRALPLLGLMFGAMFMRRRLRRSAKALGL